jgi:DNA mismatch endonuclease (patch repair protein)
LQKSFLEAKNLDYFWLMTDVHNRETRSYNMSQIRSKGTKPEIMVRKYLFNKGFRYRLNVKSLPGTPDLVLLKYKTVIFIHGCFWHGHTNCKFYTIPETKTDWWLNKINKNKQLDDVNVQKLQHLGWKVFTIFECELKGKNKELILTKLVQDL